jgi:UDP-4-amino-4-deoxy-L-arabinose-oxoglutarate aminotransferase
MIEIREEFLPIAVPDISDEEVDEVVEALRSGWISVGPKVKQFEEAMASRHGTRHAVAVSSCTAALFLVAKALGIGPGDKAIVPSMSWPSTANIFEQLGATAIFADVERSTANIIPETIEPLLQEHGGEVKAIVPVHMSGLPVDIEGIEALAAEYGVPVFYDAAHAVFSECKGKPIGSFGLASCFSFYATKNLTCGDAGIVTTNDDELAEQIRLWSYHGMNKDAWKRYSDEGCGPHVECMVPGYKLNLTDLHAALGIAQLRRADVLLAKRNKLVRTYNQLLEGMSDIEIPIHKTTEGKWGNHVYGIRMLDDSQDRSKVMDTLREYKVGTNIHFYPTHMHTFYRDKYPAVSLPNTEWLGERLISLPLCSKYELGDLEYVVALLRQVLDSGIAVKDKK